jgi:Transposase
MKYVGLDWASQAHDVTVLDEAGKVLDRWAFPHSEVGWLMTLDRLRRQGPPEELPVCLERTGGLVVDRLLAAGHPVVPVHPTAFFAARPRWGASRAKSDPGDSYKLADYLRTDSHRLRRLTPVDPGLQELQALVASQECRHPCFGQMGGRLVRLRDNHVRARTAASNQLTALLDAYWPGPRQLFTSLMSPIALAFLTTGTHGDRLEDVCGRAEIDCRHAAGNGRREPRSPRRARSVAGAGPARQPTRGSW